jgi:leader peptidase (prepilin peptidase) / N-methyltransferase
MLTATVYLLPLFAFICLGGKAVVVDIQEHRLPNCLTAGTTLAVTVAELASSMWRGSWDTWPDVALTVLETLTVYLLLYVASRGALGFGDVKFSIPCAVAIGCYCPDQWMRAIWFSFGTAAVFAVFSLRRNHLQSKSAIPFGPFMLLGTVFVIVDALVSG